MRSTTDAATRYARSRRRRQVAAVLLVVAGVAWLPLNHDIEGPVLYAIDATHGITTADLLSVGMFLVARVLFLSRIRMPARLRDRSRATRPATLPASWRAARPVQPAR